MARQRPPYSRLALLTTVAAIVVLVTLDYLVSATT